MTIHLSVAFRGKIALVTGASSGIGAEIALRLAKDGMHVLLVARRADRLQEMQRRIETEGGKADWFACDLGDFNQLEALITQIKVRFGAPEILVNNAGFGWYGYLKDMPWNEADDLLRVNIVALTRLTQAFMPQMTARNSGHIINLGSIVGVMPNQGIALYSGSKAYVDAFTTALHRELRGTQVHAGVIRPGPVKTEFFDLSAKLPGSTRIPGEQLAATSAQVADEIIRQLNHPKRFRFVPGWMRVTAWVEFYFGWVVDLVGPILLRNRQA